MEALKTKSAILAFFILTSSCLYSQAQLMIGGTIGLNKNHLSDNLSNRDFTELVNGSGYAIGVVGKYRLNNQLSLQADIGIISKNYLISRTDFFTGVNTNIKNTYLHIPLFLQIDIPLGNKFQSFIATGFYGGYWLNQRIVADLPNILAPKEFDQNTAYESFLQLVSKQSIKTDRTFNKEVDNRIELGPAAALGIEYQISKSYTVLTTFRYFHSISDQQKKYQLRQIPKYNRTSSIGIGLLYAINPK